MFDVGISLGTTMRRGERAQPGGALLTIADEELYTNGVFQAYLSPWGRGALQRPADYEDAMMIDPNSFPAGSRINWRWLPATAPDGAVRAYLYAGYGNPVHPDGVPVDPVRVSDLDTLTIAYRWQATGNDSYSQLTEFFLLADPQDHDSKVAEVGWFTRPHPSAVAYAAGGALVGTLTDAWGVQWTVHRRLSGVANNFFMVLPTSGGPLASGRLDARQLLDFLIAKEMLSGDEYLPGYMVGFEIVDDGGQGAFDLSFDGRFDEAPVMRSVPIDAGSFFAVAPTPWGRAIGYNFIRNSYMTDASIGAPAEPWRIGPTRVLASYGVTPSGFDAVTHYEVSKGARDYAMLLDASPDVFGGSFHGGETVTSEVMLADGVPFAHTDAVEAREFRIERTSLIDWGGGKTATVALVQVIAGTRTVLEGTITSAAPMSPWYVASPSFTPQFDQIRYGTTEVTLADGDHPLPIDVRALRFRNRATGYFADVEIEVPPLEALTVTRTPHFIKLYPKLPAGVPGTVQFVQRVHYGYTPLPTPPTPVGPSDIVINGGFDSEMGWTNVGWDGKSIGGGTLNFVGVAAYENAVQSSVPFVAGKYYDVTYTLVSHTAGGVFVRFDGGTGRNGTVRSAVGTYSQRMQANAGNTQVHIMTIDDGTTLVLDDLSVVGPYDTP